MAEKVLKTRIQLKYDSYSNWMNVGGTFVPKKGEVIFFNVEASTGAVQQEPAILFKVGDGNTVLNSLPWGSAISADVYAWAKKASLQWSDIDDTFKGELETFVGENSVSDVYQLVASGEQAFKLQKKDGKDESAEWEDVTTIDLAAAFSKKVDKEIIGTAGKAMIFNEADGGGAKFEYTDGTASYVGVHDKSNGVGVQIYVDKNSTEGVIIDVTGDKAYYHKGAFGTATSRDVSTNEIATIGDITGTIGGFEMKKKETADAGYVATYYLANNNGEQKGVSINIPKDFLVKSAELKTATEKDNPYTGAEIGDKYVDFVINAKDGTENVEHVYLPVKDLVDVYTAGDNIEVSEDNKISLKDNFSAEISGTNGKSIIFNEADGGGSKFEGATGKDTAYVGTHDSIGGKVGTQIYVDKADGTSSTIIDVTADGAFYTKGAVQSGSQRDVSVNEIATVGKIQELALPEYNVTVNGEAGTYTGQANVPVYFDITPAADKVTVNSYSIGLTTDAEQTAEKFTMDVPCATSETAGLMSAVDKIALDYVANVQEGDGIDIKTVDNKPVINVSLNDIAAEGTTPAHYSGLKFTDNKLEVDEDLVWVFDCGDSTEQI